MTTKDRLHELINKLPENSTGAAEHFLQYLMETPDPVLQALWNAPLKEESFTSAERAALAEGWDDILAGRTVSLDDIEKNLTDKQ